MKLHTDRIEVATTAPRQLVDVTEQARTFSGGPIPFGRRTRDRRVWMGRPPPIPPSADFDGPRRQRRILVTITGE